MIPGVKELIKQHQPIFNVFDEVRKTFYCLICDFHNQKYFDVRAKKMVVSERSCVNLARKTVYFAEMTYKTVYKELLNLTNAIQNFRKMFPGPKMLIEEQIKQIDDCILFVKTGKNLGARKCFAYCSNFNFNATAPIIEGVPEFLHDVITQLKEFKQEYGRVQIQKGRVLDVKRENGKLLSKSRKLEEEDKKAKLLQNQRSLLISFQKEDIGVTHDFYDPADDDPKKNEYEMNAMFSH